jgi:hypothetical protein
MSQHDLNIANQGFPAFRADLNDALVALGSTNSGATAPATTYANQLWYDTANNILKIRNEDNDAWISLLTLDQTADTITAIGALIIANAVTLAGSQTLTNKIINASQLVDASISQAKIAQGVAGTGTAFSAYQSSGQSLTANTITKIQLQTEEFDTDNCFDNVTNYRFTPNVAGYYQVNGAFSGPDRTYYVIYIYKNGVAVRNSNAGNGTTSVGGSVSALVFLNGTTDYIELYALCGNTITSSAGQANIYFQASLARSQ